MSVTVAPRPTAEVVRTRRAASALVIGLAGVGWLALSLWSTSPYARYLHHGVIADSDIPAGAAVGLFVGGWVLMIAAMMFPSTQQLVATFSVVIRERPDRTRLQLALLGGYATIWTATGFVALLADYGVHEIVHRSPWLEHNPWVISAFVLAGAGLYQFSPIKDRCLSECRSPRTFVYARWRGRNPLHDAFQLGIGHGRFCVGCCAALMLLTFAVGIGSLGWMLALGAVMTIEKVAPWGARIVRPVGIALALAASVVVIANI